MKHFLSTLFALAVTGLLSLPAFADVSTPQAVGNGNSANNPSGIAGALGNQGNGMPVGNAGGYRPGPGNASGMRPEMRQRVEQRREAMRERREERRGRRQDSREQRQERQEQWQQSHPMPQRRLPGQQ